MKWDANPWGHALKQQDWFGLMQQAATRFAGRDHSAADVVKVWREAFGGGHPFQSLLQGMQGPGMENFAQWNDAGAPWLHGLQGEAVAMLSLPAFGFAREHQERLQALGKAQLRMREAGDAYGTLLAKVSQDAFSRFESKLAEREEPGRRIGSVRALFDLWVDAAEEAWADAALSPEYRRTFGEMVNAQMQLRVAAQDIGEQMAGAMGLPGRTELDSAHRKIAELERMLRRMQRGEAAASPKPSADAAAPAAPVRRSPAKKAAAKRAPARRAAAPVAKKAAARQAAAARKPAKKAATPVKKKPAKPAARKR